jgi:apolipoprotein D and lipocalin family protein
MYKIIIFLICIIFSCSVVAQTNQPTTVSNVDLQLYMGTWYEIASFPNFFQRGCSCTSATYAMLDNKVAVTNKCYKNNSNKITTAHGIAWPVDGSNNSKLKVQFFWPFTGDYWILYLTKGYQQVIVGSPSMKYLWLLSRSPHINKNLYDELTEIAKNKGFQIEKLVITKQNCN